MADPETGRKPDDWKKLRDRVEAKEDRKLKAQGEKNRAVWFGLGMFGLIGWAVVIPTLVCTAIGAWIDATWPSRYSWTLMFLFIGVVLGCLNAWVWIKRESSGT